MTLVMSMLTPTAIYQVSDRRLVWVLDGKIVREDDERNKAVSWSGRMAFSFTGLAELGARKRTDLWLAEQMSEFARSGTGDQLDLLNWIAARASELFAERPWSKVPPELRRHAFVAVGWGRIGGVDPRRPYFARVSNFHDDSRELAEAREEFVVGWEVLDPNSAGFLNVTGAAFSDSERSQLLAVLADHDRGGGDPDGFVYILGEEIRRVAARDPTVGRGLLATVIPLAALEEMDSRPGHVMLVASGPLEKTPTFLYVPPGETNGVTYGPTFVHGEMVLTDFEGGRAGRRA